MRNCACGFLAEYIVVRRHEDDNGYAAIRKSKNENTQSDSITIFNTSYNGWKNLCFTTYNMQ